VLLLLLLADPTWVWGADGGRSAACVRACWSEGTAGRGLLTFVGLSRPAGRPSLGQGEGEGTTAACPPTTITKPYATAPSKPVRTSFGLFWMQPACIQRITSPTRRWALEGEGEGRPAPPALVRFRGALAQPPVQPSPSESHRSDTPSSSPLLRTAATSIHHGRIHHRSYRRHYLCVSSAGCLPCPLARPRPPRPEFHKRVG
jgi:hypothetical protein